MTKGGQVEIIGWLYQYYNTEPKDIAFKKKKYDESDIPAVTQLFTPDWIVKYLVENSLGRYWIDVLHAKGDSRTEAEIANYFQWSYFMPQAEQNTRVQVSSKTPDLSSVKLTDITLMDPAMGSGHILVYAFDLFMQLYESEGFSKRDATRLIMQNNLFGLDIDTRAFQLSYFALCMKAKKYNRRFLTLNIRPKVFDIPETSDLSSDDFQELIADNDKKLKLDLTNILSLFKHGNDYGSLIMFKQEPDWAALKKLATTDFLGSQLSFENIQLTDKQSELLELIQIGKLLTNQFTISVTNPPYMGSGKMDPRLKKYVTQYFSDSKSDLFGAFIERLREMTTSSGYYSLITQHSWMFLSGFEKLRIKLSKDTLINMAHLGTRAFEEIGGEVVQSTAFVLKKQTIIDYLGTYERLVNFNSQQRKENAYLKATGDTTCKYLYRTNQANFSKIPGSPIAYWVNQNIITSFTKHKLFGEVSNVKVGLSTGNNSLFLRYWFEVSHSNITFNAKNSSSVTRKWVPIDKGGSYRKWYGNYEYVVNWDNGGEELANSSATIRNPKFYFKSALTWSDVTSGSFAMRYRKAGSVFTTVGLSAFIKDNSDYDYLQLLGVLNTKVGNYYFKLLNPTIHLNISDVANFPLVHAPNIKNVVTNNLEISNSDWDSFETSWDFSQHPLLTHIADDKRAIWYYSLALVSSSAENGERKISCVNA